jgi:hypothetical protein
MPVENRPAASGGPLQKGNNQQNCSPKNKTDTNSFQILADLGLEGTGENLEKTIFRLKFSRLP